MLTRNSMYAENLELYFELFGRENIKVMLFDDLARDPKAFAKTVYEFLGLEFVEEEVLPPARAVGVGLQTPVESGDRPVQLRFSLGNHSVGRWLKIGLGR